MSRKKFNTIKIAIYECRDCGTEFRESEDTRDCPECGCSISEIVGYDELDPLSEFLKEDLWDDVKDVDDDDDDDFEDEEDDFRDDDDDDDDEDF